MSLEHVLLGLLRRPASGYDLRKELEASVGQFWDAPLSQIYPTLRRLEERGLLRSHGEPSTRGPARRVYERTLDGWEELTEWLRKGPVRGRERFPHLAQLSFLEELDSPETTVAFVVELRSQWRGELDRVRKLGAVAAFQAELGLRLRARLLEAQLAWADEVLESLQAAQG